MRKTLKISPPIELTPSQKREMAKRKRELVSDIETGMRGPFIKITDSFLKDFLKEARRRFPDLAK